MGGTQTREEEEEAVCEAPLRRQRGDQGDRGHGGLHRRRARRQSVSGAPQRGRGEEANRLLAGRRLLRLWSCLRGAGGPGNRGCDQAQEEQRVGSRVISEGEGGA